jgi:hypothetical protein
VPVATALMGAQYSTGEITDEWLEPMCNWPLDKLQIRFNKFRTKFADPETPYFIQRKQFKTLFELDKKIDAVYKAFDPENTGLVSAIAVFGAMALMGFGKNGPKLQLCLSLMDFSFRKA